MPESDRGLSYWSIGRSVREPKSAMCEKGSCRRNRSCAALQCLNLSRVRGNFPPSTRRLPSPDCCGFHPEPLFISSLSNNAHYETCKDKIRPSYNRHTMCLIAYMRPFWCVEGSSASAERVQVRHDQPSEVIDLKKPINAFMTLASCWSDRRGEVIRAFVRFELYEPGMRSGGCSLRNFFCNVFCPDGHHLPALGPDSRVWPINTASPSSLFFPSESHPASTLSSTHSLGRASRVHVLEPAHQHTQPVQRLKALRRSALG